MFPWYVREPLQASSISYIYSYIRGAKWRNAMHFLRLFPINGWRISIEAKRFKSCFEGFYVYFPESLMLGKKVNVYQAAVPKEQLYAANINDELSAAWLKRAADPGQTKKPWLELGIFWIFPRCGGWESLSFKAWQGPLKNRCSKGFCSGQVSR